MEFYYKNLTEFSLALVVFFLIACNYCVMQPSSDAACNRASCSSPHPHLTDVTCRWAGWWGVIIPDERQSIWWRLKKTDGQDIHENMITTWQLYVTRLNVGSTRFFHTHTHNKKCPSLFFLSGWTTATDLVCADIHVMMIVMTHQAPTYIHHISRWLITSKRLM